MAASITMVTPLHHHLKLNGATPTRRRLLLWVITPFRHSIIVYSRKGGWGWVRKADNIFLGGGGGAT